MSGGTALMMAAFATLSQIVHYLTAAGGVADVDGVFQIEMRGESGQVGSVVIHIVAVGGLRGAAVAAAVVGDHAIALIQEEQHLVVPVVGGERPAVAEDHGLAGTPVLVKNLDAVLGGDGGHV